MEHTYLGAPSLRERGVRRSASLRERPIGADTFPMGVASALSLNRSASASALSPSASAPQPLSLPKSALLVRRSASVRMGPIGGSMVPPYILTIEILREWASASAGGYGMGMVWYGYGMGMVWVWYGYGMGMGLRVGFAISSEQT
jgi:hypothetical protein